VLIRPRWPSTRTRGWYAAAFAILYLMADIRFRFYRGSGLIALGAGLLVLGFGVVNFLLMKSGQEDDPYSPPRHVTR
jgi:hypothetical protein